MAEFPAFPEGTKVFIEDRQNADGSWSVIRRYLAFPDGSTRDLPVRKIEGTRYYFRDQTPTTG